MRRETERTARKVITDGRLWLLAPAAFVMIFRIYARFNADFAEWYSLKIYRPVSLFMHKITSLLPVSVGEILLIAFIIFCLAMLVRFFIRLVKLRNKGAEVLAFFTGLLCTAAVMLFLFETLEGINYQRRSFAYTEDIPEDGVYTAEQLTELCEYLTREAVSARKGVKTGNDGVAELSDSFENTAGKAVEAYSKLAKRYGTLTDGYLTVKPVFFSVFMSMAQITGVYSPFTAEANINDEVPDFTIPFTMCHELTHLQGYMREEEANFLAFLACAESEDADILYSGYLNAWIEAANALYKADPEAYSRVREGLSDGMKSDLKAINEYWDRFEGVVAEISTAVNDTYLKVNDQPQGVASYGMAVNLLLAYYFTYIK